jgi:UDP-N-acetylmuramoyl-tripeptide--D-alanyl-D-alanine ligase
MTLDDAAQAVQGCLQGFDAQEAEMSFQGIGTDTRCHVAGTLFVALQGPRFDAHELVSDACSGGAVAAMVARAVDADLPQIVVADTRLALAQLAAAWRARFDIPVVAVTGSNGKTTVKEMLAGILAQNVPQHGVSQPGKVLATQGNMNNEIGVPLTLLKLDAEHTAAVIEEGASRPGDIAWLTRWVRPTLAVVTNAAEAHLQGFGSLEAVARTKGEIFEELDSQGIAVINADDPHVGLWRRQAGDRRVVSFGIDNIADVHGTWTAPAGLHMVTPAGELKLSLPLAGRHNALNALAATAAAVAVGASLAAVAQGLKSLRPLPGRLQWRAGVQGARILDDTYNANPVSLHAALAVLSECSGDRYLALGDMAELGNQAEALHRQAGRQARESGVHRLYAVGELARLAAQAFGDQGRHFPAQEQLISQLREDLHENVSLLVKGSRSAHMEQVVEALAAAGGTD